MDEPAQRVFRSAICKFFERGASDATCRTSVPEYKVPSRTTFSRSVIPELYAKEKERVKGELRHHFNHGTPCYSVTTDGWSSRPGDSYVSFTCHLLDEEFSLRNYQLACRHMPEGHTSENLKNVLLDLAEEWGLPQGIPVFIVTDNARNFLGAALRTGWLSIQCFAHTLQLCINCAKKDTSNFEQLCIKAQGIGRYYKRSSQARNRLKELKTSMGLEPLEVIQDVVTRWNSEYEMMARLLKLRRPISLDLSEQDTLEDFTSSEWRLMASVTLVLKCIDDATRESCSEKHPTLSQVVPLVHCMQLLLTQQERSPPSSHQVSSAACDARSATPPALLTRNGATRIACAAPLVASTDAHQSSSRRVVTLCEAEDWPWRGHALAGQTVWYAEEACTLLTPEEPPTYHESLMDCDTVHA
ncbi:hypothetical protein MTO96_043061 [Rhipicephalus appendiculatus]